MATYLILLIKKRKRVIAVAKAIRRPRSPWPECWRSPGADFSHSTSLRAATWNRPRRLVQADPPVGAPKVLRDLVRGVWFRQLAGQGSPVAARIDDRDFKTALSHGAGGFRGI